MERVMTMKHCEDCIHDEVCGMWAVDSGIPFANADTCVHYKAKNDVIELPCKIGAKLYDVSEFFEEDCSHPEIYELKDNELIVFKPSFFEEYGFTYDGIFIGRDDVGKTMFYTREEAEQAVKDMRRGDKL